MPNIEVVWVCALSFFYIHRHVLLFFTKTIPLPKREKQPVTRLALTLFATTRCVVLSNEHVRAKRLDTTVANGKCRFLYSKFKFLKVPAFAHTLLLSTVKLSETEWRKVRKSNFEEQNLARKDIRTWLFKYFWTRVREWPWVILAWTPFVSVL